VREALIVVWDVNQHRTGTPLAIGPNTLIECP
jgi:hypothetical protein